MRNILFDIPIETTDDEHCGQTQRACVGILLKNVQSKVAEAEALQHALLKGLRKRRFHHEPSQGGGNDEKAVGCAFALPQYGQVCERVAFDLFKVTL